jgi:hypothetical protein
MDARADWPMIGEIGIWYHEDWLYTDATDEQTQDTFLKSVPAAVPAQVAAEIRRLLATTSTALERRRIMIDAGGFDYGNLPDDPDDFLRSWLRAMELASGGTDAG